MYWKPIRVNIRALARTQLLYVLEVERAWARRPVLKVWLEVNNPQTRGLPSLIVHKAQSKLNLEFQHFYLLKARANSRLGLVTQSLGSIMPNYKLE